MKIAVALNDRRRISREFGNISGFAIYTISGKNVVKTEYYNNDLLYEYEKRRNSPEIVNDESFIEGAFMLNRGRKKPNPLSDCDVVISGDMGESAYRILKRSKKKVFLVNEMIPEDAVERYLSNLLINDWRRIAH